MSQFIIVLGTRYKTPMSLLLSLLLFSSNPLLAQEAGIKMHEAETEKGSYNGATNTVYPDWFKTSFLDLDEDVAEASEAGKRLMLIFHQDGCPYCNAFVEKNFAQKDIVDTLQSKFDVLEINMWGAREVASVEGEIYTEKEFAAALKVQFTPTVLFLDENGALALRINGFYGPDRFRHVLDYVSQKKETLLSFNEYIAQVESDRTSSKQLLSRPYFSGPINQLSERPGKGNKPLLLFFEQGSCPNCEALHDKVLSKTKSRKLLDRFDVYQINMWGRDSFTTPDGVTTTGRNWSKELNISYAPTLVLFSAEGEEVIRSEAWFKTFHTQSILDFVVSDAWRTQSSFQRYMSARADELREQGIDVDIWD